MNTPKPPVRSRKRPPSPTFAENTLVSGGVLHDNLRLHIQHVPPKTLKPPKRKLRKHSKRQLAAIQTSICENGFLDPILVSNESQIICGHGRWLAATALGLSLVPVIELVHLTAEQLRLYAIAENKLGDMSEFDFGEIKLEFGELEALNLDLNLELSGFSTSEIDDLHLAKSLAGDGAEGDGADDIPLIQAVAITQDGDVWQLGCHRLIRGDSREEAPYVTLLQGEKAQMGLTDPPYNLKAKDYSGLGKHAAVDFKMAFGELSPPQFTEFIATYSAHMVAHSVDGAIAFHCMDWRHMGEMLQGAGRVYTELKNLIIYKKHSAGMGTFYRSQHELIFAWKGGTAPHINNFGLGETGRFRSNVWEYRGNCGFHRERDSELAAHGTVKPWSMFADAMRDCSHRGGIVLDPFGGSGTTLIAAERTGRRARVIEIDGNYCDVAIRRWEKLTGKDAVLIATGQTFSEVADERLGHQDGPENSLDEVTGEFDGDDEEDA